MLSSETISSLLGDGKTNQVIKRMNGFAFMHDERIDELAEIALNENWGKNNFALRKYLSVHVPWSLQQNYYTVSNNQFYVRAGHLQTRYGTPVYLVFEENHREDPLFKLVHVGTDISAPDLPEASNIPDPPVIPIGAEIVMLHDHILRTNSDRVKFLTETPPVAQMCAVSGAIQWSLNRGLEIPYWYYGTMNYLVPLYLQSREDITQAPDVIAPVQINKSSLTVRTVLEPHMPYANARVAVKRHDQLPTWMASAWNAHSALMSETNIEDPESSPEA